MARRLRSDHMLFVAALLLLCCGVVMVYSTSVTTNVELWKQGLIAVLGLALLALAMQFDYRHYREMPFVYALVAVTGGALVVVLFMPPVNNSHRWFNVFGFGVQPSEFAKLVAVIFTAATLERRLSRADDIPYLVAPIVAVGGVFCGLIFWEPDMGGALIVAFLAGALVFGAGLPWRHLVGACAAAAPVGVAALFTDGGYRWRRFVAFLDPSADPLKEGHQLIQSFTALGSGGLFGKGVGAGTQKLKYLPEAHSDFVYAVIGEELGLIGTTLILLCFAVIIWRGLRLAPKAPDAFGAFLALGITLMIGMQALMNMSVVLGMVPTKGVALPMVSAGGSSMLVTLLGVGILLNISQHASAQD